MNSITVEMKYIGKELQKLMLVIKQALQLLDAFSFSLKQKIVFSDGHCYKIFGAIVVPNTVQVVDYPSFWQKFAIGLLPSKNVFGHIAIAICPWVRGRHNKDISLPSSNSTPSPRRVLCTRPIKIANLARSPKVLCVATLTPYRFWSFARDLFTTILAIVLLHTYIITHSSRGEPL